VTAATPAARQSLRGGGLRMLMQPIVDLRTGEVHQVEALARLALGDGRLVSPLVFLPLLDDDDLDLLFRESVDQALASLAGWDAQGVRLTVSVNLAPSTLRDPFCVDWVAALLDRHSVAAERLEVELLETDVLDTPVQDDSLVRLRALGVAVAIDDVGSGYSTPERVASMPFDRVKIDRELLKVLIAPTPAFATLADLIDLGLAAGCDVVVEGIEDVAQAEVALVLGATHGQGYLFGRPMPADDVPAWVVDHNVRAEGGKVTTSLGRAARRWRSAAQRGAWG
jgi:EAL domain-containing protein (putative c-di-GMP-specific phosphodiesterase class I)